MPNAFAGALQRSGRMQRRLLVGFAIGVRAGMGEVGEHVAHTGIARVEPTDSAAMEHCREKLSLPSGTRAKRDARRAPRQIVQKRCGRQSRPAETTPLTSAVGVRLHFGLDWRRVQKPVLSD
jgi:hypothetical protein